ncbi:metallophosphoesterase [Thalassotalea sp. 1_MG-2023]|uniref:metallophosphoesterase n=1 Tax=Thalassotalea sp. 1_MG-2023 TaxID=3062680 RepID=UPI0026E29A40|nr:metallophosphoesterase [Thalassotalea sp. 1_MG-2023]MDO6427919.1 metallophosphoesterase [Thalassotalea sp. 1_MG-2023]
MFNVLKTNLKHFFVTFILVFSLIVAIGIYHGAEAHFNENRLAYTLDKEGPHIFIDEQTLTVNYVRGSKESGGFYRDSQQYSVNEDIKAMAYFPLEQQEIPITINPRIEVPPSTYQDNKPMLAISDIEGGYKAFRDFLLAHNVIDSALTWQFGQGHLVLVGDFVDRGNSVTQVLWLIYKLEQEAKKQGGHVHYILGNHEIKNLQANFYSASQKYLYIAAMLGKTQAELYDDNSFIGQWLASKNSVEKINGYLFVHGGIHPKLSEFDYSLEKINQIVRAHYRKPFFTRLHATDDDFLVSNKTGPSWYRGYFKDDLTQQEVQQGLDKFSAKAVIVGHTIQWQVQELYQGKVVAIDVRHPSDYETHFPPRSSEGLLIKDSLFYRLLADGSKKQL